MVSWLLWLSLLACGTHPATQVLMVFHAEEGLRADVAQLRVRIEGPTGDLRLDETKPLAPGSATLARIPVIPLGGDATRTFRLTGVLLTEDAIELASVEAIAGFAEDELREVHLWFDDACRAREPCGTGRTCIAGVCRGACFEPRLPGTETRSFPWCGECESCTAGACQPIGNGTACGCPETDSCNAGACITTRPVAETYGGEVHSCALVRGGGVELVCWGSNRTQQLGTEGNSSLVPVPVAMPAPATGALGDDHTCWLTFNGERYCWGFNANGQLGNGTTGGAAIRTPTPASEGDPTWESLTSGWLFSCGLTTDGRVLCWGLNDNGQCGIDPELESVVPSPNIIGREDRWVAISAGGFRACGIRQDRTLWCWGRNASGELGVGDGDNRFVPTQVGCTNGSCLDEWEAVAAGSFHTCGLRGPERELWCWGGALNGQLGVGAMMTRDSLVPVRVDMSGWRAIAAGRAHTCGIQGDGSLWCWGNNDFGQLGTGDLERRSVPVRVGRPTDEWIRLGLGRYHTCAVRSDETLWCWGQNDAGQLGVGSVTESGDSPMSRPTRVCL